MRVSTPIVYLMCLGLGAVAGSLQAAPPSAGDGVPSTLPAVPVWSKRADLKTPAAVEEALISPLSAGFGAGSCRAGYYQVGARLCMTGAIGPTSFANAMAYCQAISGSVAGYGEWRYRILYGDGIMPPVGWWLGPITGDNEALFVNQAVVGDFDGVTSRFDSRYFVCAHDDTL